MGKIGNKVEKSIQNSGRTFAIIASLATIVMAVMGTADVIGTKIFKTPVPITYEVTEAMMVVLAFGGLAYAQHIKRHVKVDLLVLRFSPAGQIVSELIGLLAGTIFFVILTWVSLGYFWKSWLIKEAESGLIPFPVYPSKLVMLIGSLLMTLQLLIDLSKMPAKFRQARFSANNSPEEESS